MRNRPDPEVFARYSYLLAFASGGIIIVSAVFWLIPGPVAAALVNVIWLALITGVAGTFMGFAANSDFKRSPGSEQAVNEAKVGLRINLLTSIVMILFVLLGIAIRIFMTTPIMVTP